jgi:hypothetical protein
MLMKPAVAFITNSTSSFPASREGREKWGTRPWSDQFNAAALKPRLGWDFSAREETSGLTPGLFSVPHRHD